MSVSYEQVPWKRSACATVEDINFYPEPGHDYKQHVDAAKEVCNSCPIQMQCLEYALANEDHGIWGGLGPAERQSMRRSIIVSKDKRKAPRIVPSFTVSNERRVIEAASGAIVRLQEALDAVGSQAMPQWVEAAKLRIDNPTKSLSEVASLAKVSKNTYVGRLRRIIDLHKEAK